MLLAEVLVYGSVDPQSRNLANPPRDSEYLRLINYGTPTSSDLQVLEKSHGLTAPPRDDIRSGHWEIVVDSAIITDLSHAVYGDKQWCETELYTGAQGKSADDMRQTAIYLDHNEQIVINTLSSNIVFVAYEAAKLQPVDSQTESLCAIFDLAVNFIIYMAFKLHEEKSKVTSAAFGTFMDTNSAYKYGRGLIFQRGSPQANRFLTTVYRYTVSCVPAMPYFGGHSLHLYMGPRRTFGKIRTHSLRAELLRELGLSALVKEMDGERLSGPLDELHANFIISGPFKFGMSEHIEDHLTFRLDGRVILYNPNKYDYLVLFRNCIAEYVLSLRSQLTYRGHGLHEFGVEFWKTYLLLFARNESSLHVATRLGVNMSLLRTCRDHIFPDNVSLQLEDFPFFQHRLRLIQEKMDDWRPQKVKELWMRGYSDPLTYYTFIGGLFFGILGIVGVAASIVQAVGQFVA